MQADIVDFENAVDARRIFDDALHELDEVEQEPEVASTHNPKNDFTASRKIMDWMASAPIF